MGRVWDKNRKTLYWTDEYQKEVDVLADTMRRQGIAVDRGDKLLVGAVLLYALRQANRLAAQKEISHEAN